ncbi:MAG: hypothetical protein ACYC2H_05760 [Thermoplasmatota archaeon]
MRALALFLSLLLLLSPLASAQDGEEDGSRSSSSSSSPSPSRGPEGNETPEDPHDPPEQDPDQQSAGDGCPPQGPTNPQEVQACRERYCRNHPDDPRCPRAEQGDDEEGQADGGPSEWRRWCRDEAHEDEQRDRCRQELSEFANGTGRWVSFRVDAANASLLDYRVDGLLVAESIHLETGSDNLTVRSTGSALRIGDEDTELVLHDDPTGLIRLKGDDGSLTIILPANATVRHSEDGTAARIEFVGGRTGHLRSENATFLDDHTVLASGFLALLIPHEREAESPPRNDEEQGHDEEVNDAIEDRRIGAEITLHQPAPAIAAAADGNATDGVEVLAYDDVQVQVQMPSNGVATPEAPIRIEVSADLAEGRTIVLNVNRTLLESSDPKSLVLGYFDLHEQADGSILETEVLFRQASSLQDVLDPTDDGGSPEYWVVEDANGLQLMASVPHWSAHAITLSSLALITAPNVMAGLMIGVAGSLVAGAVLFWPRRAKDD